jgi:hypothetical protein
LKPGQWGSLLVQEKYQVEKACDKRQQNKTKQNNHNNNNKDLITEIQRMWNVKAKVISTNLRNYKKTNILGTVHILWEVLL